MVIPVVMTSPDFRQAKLSPEASARLIPVEYWQDPEFIFVSAIAPEIVIVPL
jgi:hypothetical protein